MGSFGTTEKFFIMASSLMVKKMGMGFKWILKSLKTSAFGEEHF